MKKLTFVIVFITIILISAIGVQTDQGPVVNTVNAADDDGGDSSWGGGSECDSDNGGPCTDTAMTGPCYPYLNNSNPNCPAQGQLCYNGCGTGVCMPLPSPTPPSITPPAPTPTIQPTISPSSSPRGRYVCDTDSGPEDGDGPQLQLKTLKCEFVN